MKNNPKYENINMSEFSIDFNLNDMDNLRDIKRKIHNQVIDIISNAIK